MDRSQSGLPGDVLEALNVPHAAQTVWRILLGNPTTTTGEIEGLTGLGTPEIMASIEALIDARLVRQSTAPVGATAIDPTLAIESHISRCERGLAEGAEQLAELRTHIPDLAKAYARGRASVDGGELGIEIVIGLADIRRQIYLATDTTTADARSIYYASTVAGERDGLPADRDMIARGVRCRSIVGPHELSDPELYAALRLSHEYGESFRALPEIPTRLLVLDRKLAVLPVDPVDLQLGAVFVRLQSLVDVLVILFDHLWSVADPIFGSEYGSDAPSGRQARTLELMAIGNKDERIARTLGVGSRTIRRDISDLKEMLGVSSRAEIVAAAIRRGWL